MQGGIVNIVEDVADINLVGRDARGAAAVASSSGAPLLKPVRGENIDVNLLSALHFFFLCVPVLRVYVWLFVRVSCV